MRFPSLLLITLLAAPLGARASGEVPARAPRVWLAPLQTQGGPGASLLSGKFDEKARQTLSKSDRVEMRGAGAAGAPVSAGAADPRVEQAENLRAAGQAAFVAGDHAGARQNLLAALELYEDALASVERVEAIVETIAWLGAVSIELGYDGDAEDFFRRALAVTPDLDPPEGSGDTARALLEDARGKLGRRHGVTLKVVTEPPGAAVRVDGQDRGPSPVEVAGLWRGAHYVQARDEAAGAAAAVVTAKGRRPVSTTLTLQSEVGPTPVPRIDPALSAELRAQAARGELGEPFQNGCGEVARQNGAEYVVVGNIAAEGNAFVLRAFVFGVEEHAVVPFDPFPFSPNLASSDAQAALFAGAVEDAANHFPRDRALIGGLTTPAEPGPPEPLPPAPDAGVAAAPPPPPPRDEEPWYTAWWVWTLVGVAVIGGTAYGGYVLLEDEPVDGTFNAKVTW